MDDKYSSRRSFFSVSWRRVFLTLLFVLPPLLGFWAYLMAVPPTIPPLRHVVLGLVVIILSLMLLAGMVLLSNERAIRILISFAFILILFLGVVSFAERDAAVLAPLVALSLIAFWVINQLPTSVLAVVAATIGCTVVLHSLGNILALGLPFPLWTLFRSRSGGILNSAGVICFGCLVFACVYFPRRLEWKRYLRPYRIERRQVHDRAKEKNSSGTTLIEMFIVVAILGILTTSLLSVWTYTIRTQKGLGERAQIAEILSSEMNMLMTTSQVPAPSSDLQALPLPFSDFGNSLKLTGGYTVTETEQAALVQITVTLTHDLGEPASRYFRMVGYRWKER